MKIQLFIYFFFCFFCFTPIYMYAQEQNKFTLQACIDYAKQHDETLKMYDFDQQIEVAKMRQTETKRLPTINGTAELRDNLQLATSILPFNPAGGSEPTAVQFGTKYNATVAIDASYNLFDPNIRNTLKNDKINIQLAENNRQQKQIDLVITIKKDYLAALLYAEQVKYNLQSVARMQKFYDDAKTLFETKQVQEVDVKRAAFDLKNKEAELAKAKQQYQQWILQLKYHIAYPLTDEIILTDTTLLKTNSFANKGANINVGNRLGYQNLLLQKEQYQTEINRLKSNYLPKVSLVAYSAYQAFRPDLNLFSANTWFNLTYVGAKLEVSIFDGLLKKRQIQTSNLQINRKNQETAAFVRQYDFDFQFNQLKAQNELQNIEIRRNNVLLAKELVQNNLDRFLAGLALAKDVTDQETKLAEAEQQYLSALYDFAITQLDAEKLAGVSKE